MFTVIFKGEEFTVYHVMIIQNQSPIQTLQPEKADMRIAVMFLIYDDNCFRFIDAALCKPWGKND